MRNTKQKSTFQFLIAPSQSKKDWYSAFCFELGLIREGKDPLELKRQINQLAFNYYRSVVENNLSDDLLNQFLPKKYELLFKKTKAEELCRKWEEILKKEFSWRLKTAENKKTPTLIS
jgi:hypothetical protein